MANSNGQANKSKSQLVREYLAKSPNASVSEIISHFKSRGVTISLALANKVKYARREVGGGARPATKVATAAPPKRKRGRPPGKAKSPHGMKVNAIREVFTTHGLSTRPVDVVRMLKERGIEVTAGQVSATRRRMIKDRRRAKVAAAAAAPQAPKPEKTTGVTLDALLAAREAAVKLGGIARMRELLDALSSLQS
jgi:pyruvate/2-oxoglutarate dehydrogenase complex dihydrolipoamide acyltransferase (E2) component